MRNTYAVFMLAVGGVMVYSGYKGWTIADTLRFFTGQPLQDKPPATAEVGDLGQKSEQEEKADKAIPNQVPMPNPEPGTGAELNPKAGGTLNG